MAHLEPSGAAAVTPCHFCALEMSGDFFDTPLMETDGFRVVASVGGFVEGWVLIVPKAHFVNLRELPSGLQTEFLALKELIALELFERFGQLIAFEHGPAKAGDPAGCGVDHAHLHLVPNRSGADIVGKVETEAGLKLETVDSLFVSDRSHSGLSYIYLEEHGATYLGFSDGVPSQVVRKVLAADLGIGDQYDWRRNPALTLVTRTVAALSDLRPATVAA